LLSSYASSVVLAGQQSALEISGQPVRAVRRLVEHGHALARHVLHPPVVVNVAEQQIAAFFPPEWPFRRPQRPAESIGQITDGLRWADDLFQLRSQLLDPLRRLGQRGTETTRHRKTSRRNSHRQDLSA